MPKSNKKKSPLKPPIDNPIYQIHEPFISSNDVIATLLKNEKTLMTIFSGKKHGSKLKHGTSNPGTGDCTFESVILNINERSSFTEKFLMPVDYYRKIWVTDMANSAKHFLVYLLIICLLLII